MNDKTHNEESCAVARKRIHAVLDGELMDATALQEMDRHLAGCAGCREARVDLEQIQHALRGMPSLPFPDDAFGEVLARTSQAPAASRLSRWGLGWRAAAAAAVLAAVAWSVWPTGPDQAEVDQAAAEARMVLMLTAQALSRSQRVAIREVFTDGVSPALSRVPMNMPGTPQEKEM